MNEVLFECYSSPSVAYGIDSLFSYRHNGGKTGLVLSSSHSSTHLIPVFDSKPAFSSVSRLNWGGSNAAEYLSKLLKLKYPAFPDRTTDTQIQKMMWDHCYVSQEYDAELAGYLDWDGLENRDRVVQYPYSEPVVVEKSTEEIDRIAERKKESGRRLQEQAAKMRLEKLVRKEEELAYYKELQQKIQNALKKDVKKLLDADDLRDEGQLDRMIRDLEKSVQWARQKDLGTSSGNEPADGEEASFPLVDVPDEELDEAGIRDKRHQRLMKSNHEARMRAKAEKENERLRLEEETRLDQEKREHHLDEWIADRRAEYDTLKQRMKERDRFKIDKTNRKSLASQMRMKTLANLASEGGGSKKRRRGGTGGDDNDDTFGANDEDWKVYRTVATGADAASDDEDAEQNLDAAVLNLEEQLLKYDSEFTENHTLAAQNDWSKSSVHMFLRGPRPFDPDSHREAHQLHLNVERIRVPEVLFQPSIAGVDQAGVVEVALDILLHRCGGGNGSAQNAQKKLLSDIFLTGGNTLFSGFDERFTRELRSSLPVDAAINVRTAGDVVLDAWRGAAGWWNSDRTSSRKAAVTRAEYLEMGSEFMKVKSLSSPCCS